MLGRFSFDYANQGTVTISESEDVVRRESADFNVANGVGVYVYAIRKRDKRNGKII